jgi:hypothetical protein
MALGTINTNQIASEAVTVPKVTDQVLSSRNLLINGDMQVAQRGSSLAMAHDGTTSGLLIDRFSFNLGGTHEQFDGTYAQVSDHPTLTNGKSLKWTTGTAESSYDADEYLYFTQVIEAQNLQQINNGNSNALPVTLSFYVKSSVTGTFAVGLHKDDTTARTFNKTYTINSANTWEKKSVTFVGDTSGGGIANDNGRGFYVNWHLAAGSTWTGGGSTSGWADYANNRWADGQATNAIATTASATWQIAQCQLEAGDVATPFEHEDIGTTLAKCQRYFFQLTDISSDGAGTFGQRYNNDTAKRTIEIQYPTTMRTSPTLTTTCPNTIDAAYIQPDGSTSVISGVNAAYATYFTAFAASAEL